LRTVGSATATSTTELAGYMDVFAGQEYSAGRAGLPTPPRPGMPIVLGELWLLAVCQPTTENANDWSVYGFTSQDDIPGWPDNTAMYTGPVRGAADVARALAAAGATVLLRHYAGFTVTSAVAETVTLGTS
jgi:hypothetical protein